jgi:hypothetical protein
MSLRICKQEANPWSTKLYEEQLISTEVSNHTGRKEPRCTQTRLKVMLYLMDAS